LITALGKAMKKDAATTFMQLDQVHNLQVDPAHTYATTIALLDVEYASPMDVQQAKDELSNLKYKFPLTSFQNKFHYLTMRANITDGERLYDTYMTAVQKGDPALSRFIVQALTQQDMLQPGVNHKTLENAKKFAAAFVATDQKQSASHHNPSNPEPMDIGSMTATGNRMALIVGTDTKLYAHVQCHYPSCQNYGHYEAQCPVKAHTVNRGTTSNDNNQSTYHNGNNRGGSSNAFGNRGGYRGGNRGGYRGRGRGRGGYRGRGRGRGRTARLNNMEEWEYDNECDEHEYDNEPQKAADIPTEI
jgi:hypothetical protein